MYKATNNGDRCQTYLNYKHKQMNPPEMVAQTNYRCSSEPTVQAERNLKSIGRTVGFFKRQSCWRSKGMKSKIKTQSSQEQKQKDSTPIEADPMEETD